MSNTLYMYLQQPEDTGSLTISETWGLILKCPDNYGKPLLPKGFQVLNPGPTGFQHWQVASLTCSVLKMYC